MSSEEYVRIETLDDAREEEYEKFLLMSPETLFYVSNQYRKFLSSILDAEDHYFLAIDDSDKIVGALPAFITRGAKHGSVLNSLPFYGSNGGIIEHEGSREVRIALLRAFDSFAEANKCVASTIITSPFEKDCEFYEHEATWSYRDERIGQITPLLQEVQHVGEELMNSFDGVRRRNIRKAVKSGIEVLEDSSMEAFEFLERVHRQNMAAIGGKAKPRIFLRNVPEFFAAGEDYRVYTASKDGSLIAALLLFRFNETVEYYMPAIVQEFRTFQPLSLIVFQAMQDAVRDGYKRWNWGGTWLSQQSLYQYKKRWGTEDRRYFYYTLVLDQKIQGMAREELLRDYPHFYVLPHSALSG